jgi:hypothetical protein
MARCVDRSVWIGGEKTAWSDVSLWTRTHRGEMKRLRHWKDVRDVELAALADATVWSHRVVQLAKGAQSVDAEMKWLDRRAVSFMDDRSARGKKPALPSGIDGEFLTHVDVIGDLHGCRFTLRELATTLGYDEQWQHAQNRRLVLLGDFADKNLIPDRNAETVRLVCSLLATGRAVAVMGNHDRKLLRSVNAVSEAVRAWEKHARELQFRELPKLSHAVYMALQADGVRGHDALAHGLRTAAGWMRANSPMYGIDLTLRDIAGDNDAAELCRTVQDVYGSLEHQLLLDGGTMIAVHAAARRDLVGAHTRRARDFSMFGDITATTTDDGYVERRDWTAAWNDDRVVVYGHEIQGDGVRISGERSTAIGVDTGAYEHGEVDGFRGLSALRWPERDVVSVETSSRDVLVGAHRRRRVQQAVVAATTRSVVREARVTNLARRGVRELADVLEENGVAGWVNGADVSRLEHGMDVEVLVCASEEFVAEMLTVSCVRLGDGVVSVRALGERAMVEDTWFGEVLSVDRRAVSLWGDAVGDQGREIATAGDARVALKADPLVALMAMTRSAASGVPLSRELLFHIKGLALVLVSAVDPGRVEIARSELNEQGQGRFKAVAVMLGMGAWAQ